MGPMAEFFPYLYYRLHKARVRLWIGFSNSAKVNQVLEQIHHLNSPLKNPSFDIYHTNWPTNKNNFLQRTKFLSASFMPAHREGEPLPKPPEMSPLPSSAAWGYYFSVECSSTGSQADSHAGT